MNIAIDELLGNCLEQQTAIDLTNIPEADVSKCNRMVPIR